LAAVDNNSASFTVIVESNADRTTVVAIVLADNLLGLELPETSVMIATGGDQVGRVGAERAVPNPALVASKRALQLEWNWAGGLASRGRDHLVQVLNLPDLRSVVSRAGSKVLDIWREQDSGDVLAVSLEVSDGDKSCLLTVLLKMPDENVSLEMVRLINPQRGARRPCFAYRIVSRAKG
jgi:hypothetical protein